MKDEGCGFPYLSSLISHPSPRLDHLLRTEFTLHALPPGGADLPGRVGMIEQMFGPAGQTGAMARANR